MPMHLSWRVPELGGIPEGREVFAFWVDGTSTRQVPVEEKGSAAPPL